MKIIVDVRDLQPGDVLTACPDDGPVKAHRPGVHDPERTEMVYFSNGVHDLFGAPQALEVER